MNKQQTTNSVITLIVTSAPTITEIAINQNESLILVQTLLMSSVGYLTKLRHMFVDKCFEEGFVLYPDAKVKKHDKSSPAGRSFLRLNKGVSKRIDRLIDLIVKPVLL
jgi:hypothetical protein